MNWKLIAEAAAPFLVFLASVFAVVAGAWSGRRAANKTAEAAEVSAKATVEDAYTRAHKAAREESRQEWAQYIEAWQRWNESQTLQLARLEGRIENLELEYEAEKLARRKIESRYGIALAYLRRVIGIVSEHLPGLTLPTPPPELEADLWP